MQLEEQFRTLELLIGTLLGSRTATLSAPSAGAAAAGEPYDPDRLPAFDALLAALRERIPQDRPEQAAPAAFENAAFFDAYFSNYIEGTRFPVDQAIAIVFRGELPERRPADAHDVLGTYRLSASRQEMQRLPETFEDLESLLRRRHAIIMEARPGALPGQFKERPNQAGATLFVDPSLVRGTLRHGFEMYRALSEPFSRALFMMFLVTEVHPFTDGNGRVARVMMNAELVAGRQARIIIPTVYRTEYVGSLKQLTAARQPQVLIRVMDRAQLFVSRLDFSVLDAAREQLAAHNAFEEPSDEVKLRMPPGKS